MYIATKLLRAMWPKVYGNIYQLSWIFFTELFQRRYTNSFHGQDHFRDFLGHRHRISSFWFYKACENIFIQHLPIWLQSIFVHMDKLVISLISFSSAARLRDLSDGDNAWKFFINMQFNRCLRHSAAVWIRSMNLWGE